jgi:carbonic anhydrase
MLELAVLNGVKVLVLTSHSDCAAEAAAADPEKREKFPALRDLMDTRVEHVEEFLARPVIRDAIDRGELMVKFARIDTNTDRLVVGDVEATFP